jgi:hypothetical protein
MAKFKKGDKVRVTVETAEDEGFHSDLESDLLSDGISYSKIDRIMALITERKTLTVTEVEYVDEPSYNEPLYGVKPSIRYLLSESQIEIV